jgi:hypothetical protein
VWTSGQGGVPQCCHRLYQVQIDSESNGDDFALCRQLSDERVQACLAIDTVSTEIAVSECSKGHFHWELKVRPATLRCSRNLNLDLALIKRQSVVYRWKLKQVDLKLLNQCKILEIPVRVNSQGEFGSAEAARAIVRNETRQWMPYCVSLSGGCGN